MSKVSRHEPGTPSWADLASDDVARAREFYSAIFGWTFVESGPEMGNYVMCLRNGAAVAGIGPRPKDAPYPSAWTTYLATADVDASAAHIKELGGTVAMGPMVVGEEGKMLVAMDTVGAAFGLWQAGRHTGSQLRDEHGSLTWCEVNTRDTAKSREFYGALTGNEVTRLETPPGMEYWTLQKDGKSVAGINRMGPDMPAELPPHWMVYFAVDDTDRAVEAAKATGGSVRVEAMDSPFGRWAMLADPSGAVFCVIKPT